MTARNPNRENTNSVHAEEAVAPVKTPRILRLADRELDLVAGGAADDDFLARRCPPKELA